MFWPLTLLRRSQPPAPTLEETRREQLRAVQFELLDALAHAERWNHTVEMLHARQMRLEAELG